MRIGVIGGTGREGRGLGLRWALAGHEVGLGSREAARGGAAAARLEAAHGVALRGGSNAEVVEWAEIVLLAVPYSAHRSTLRSLAGMLRDKLLIDITVPLVPPRVRRVQLPDGGAAALEAAELLGEGARVVATLHHVSSTHLADPDHPIDCDVLICGRKADREIVAGLIEDLGLRPVHAGVLANAVALEALTPVLLHINRQYRVPGAGLRITGLPGTEPGE